MSATIGRQLVTKEAFERIPDAFKRYEVERGELVEAPAVGNLESLIAFRIGMEIHRHLNDPATPEVLLMEARYRLARDPDLIRGCDVAYVPRDRMPEGKPGSGVGDYVPALVVEVVSPSNSASEIAKKIDQWLEAGATMVWVIYPSQQAAHVYNSPKECRIFSAGETLSGSPVLPGLEIDIARLFQ